MWLTDLFLALPTLPLLLLVMYLFRDSVKKVLGVEGGAFVLIVVVIGGLGSLPGALLGATYVHSVDFFLPNEWQFLATGVGLQIAFAALVLLAAAGGLVLQAVAREALAKNYGGHR
jgi:branched-subunit amino acid ABC-type transport system permease component